jgi:hypothetical protein
MDQNSPFQVQPEELDLLRPRTKDVNFIQAIMTKEPTPRTEAL